MSPDRTGQKESLPARFLYWEDFEGPFERAVRWGKWKAIIPINGPFQLYDLTKDIHEDHNLAERYPDVVSKIQDYLRTARSGSESWPVLP